MVSPIANTQIPAANTFKPGTAQSEQAPAIKDENAVKELNARNEERHTERTASSERSYDSGASASGSDSRGNGLDITV